MPCHNDPLAMLPPHMNAHLRSRRQAFTGTAADLHLIGAQTRSQPIRTRFRTRRDQSGSRASERRRVQRRNGEAELREAAAVRGSTHPHVVHTPLYRTRVSDKVPPFGVFFSFVPSKYVKL